MIFVKRSQVRKWGFLLKYPGKEMKAKKSAKDWKELLTEN